jgi:hypothetical protein
MGQSTIAHTLHEKILSNWMQGVFPFVFIDFGHLENLAHICQSTYPYFAKDQCTLPLASIYNWSTWQIRAFLVAARNFLAAVTIVLIL